LILERLNLLLLRLDLLQLRLDLLLRLLKRLPPGALGRKQDRWVEKQQPEGRDEDQQDGRQHVLAGGEDPEDAQHNQHGEACGKHEHPLPVGAQHTRRCAEQVLADDLIGWGAMPNSVKNLYNPKGRKGLFGGCITPAKK